MMARGKFVLHMAKGQIANIDGRTVEVADRNRTAAVSLVLDGFEHVSLRKRDGTVKHFGPEHQERTDD